MLYLKAFSELRSEEIPGIFKKLEVVLMAFYALWKWFSPWSKKKYPNMIYWYKEYVLKSPEQRALEQAQRQEEIEVLKKKLLLMNDLFSDSWFYCGM